MEGDYIVYNYNSYTVPTNYYSTPMNHTDAPINNDQIFQFQQNPTFEINQGLINYNLVPYLYLETLKMILEKMRGHLSKMELVDLEMLLIELEEAAKVNENNYDVDMKLRAVLVPKLLEKETKPKYFEDKLFEWEEEKWN